MPLTQTNLAQPLPPYLAALNPEQRKAVEATEGPVLVLAGAGTGKTRVLTSRIAHILYNKLAFPSQILAVTFTNKAAREMSTRVQKLLGGEENGQQPNNYLNWLGTFHSIAAKILRRHAELVELTSSFTILDTDDQLRLIKALLHEKNIDDKMYPPKLIGGIIEGWKDRGLTPERVKASHTEGQADAIALTLYQPYQARLQSLNAVDFGDLLLHNLTLFTNRTELLAEYAQRFRYILVDEYQDTNVAQYLWLRLLASGHHNLCCVGDDDQSIYGWRGAEVGNILKFEKDFPNATIIRLERNYRSTGHILAAASGLIAHNRGRLGKTLWTEDESGEKPRLKSTWDDREEAHFIADEVEQRQRERISLNEMAVLVRASFQTRAFEERFIALGIPYRVVGGLRFYERLEIRDAVAYLRLIAQLEDDLAFERIINTPKRGIGAGTLEHMHRMGRERNLSLYHATLQLLEAGDIKGKAVSALQHFFTLLAGWRQKLSVLTLPELMELVLEESGYRAMWVADKSPEAAGRLENLRELVQALSEFDTLGEFLEHISLVMDTDSVNNNEMITLMTLHAAKGLEFDTVFLPGWEEGLFPHQRALDESGTRGLEEERRLAYVGITRARRRLLITYAANRRIYNQWQSSIPSRFISELPADQVESIGGELHNKRAFNRELWQKEISAILAAHAGPKRPSGVAESSGNTQKFSIGERIFHQKFGYGRITEVDGTHLKIAFEKAGEKKIQADYVKKT